MDAGNTHPPQKRRFATFFSKLVRKFAPKEANVRSAEALPARELSVDRSIASRTDNVPGVLPIDNSLPERMLGREITGKLCTLCTELGFANQHTFKHHIVTQGHDGKQKRHWACLEEICGKKAFTRIHNLSSHMRKHQKPGGDAGGLQRQASSKTY